MPSPTTARSIAAKVLTEARRHKKFAGEILELYPQLAERQRATDLVFGVTRNRLAIDLVIEKCSQRLIERIPAKILNIVRVGAYELIYCPQTTEYAIVNEAVEYARQITNAKSAGFVNAVLRQIQKHIINRQRSLEGAPPRQTFPQSHEFGCEFDIEMLTDPGDSLQDYLGSVFSLPVWLAKSWIDEYGSERTRAICFASNRRPSVYLRPNLLKTTVEDLTGKLKAGGVECETATESQMIKLTSPKAITALPGFDEGLFTVQDLSAAQVIYLLNPQPDWSILDLCAAPGTKTTQLAEATAGRAKITATDVDAERLAMVRENIARLGLSGCVTAINYSDIEKQGGFDCVLVDAPCSNTGVLARRPEVRHRITENAIEQMAKVQLELLSDATGLLKPKGVICYSTCSIQPDENGLLVRRFLQGHTGFKLKAEKLTLPSAGQPDHDGSYTAIMEKGSGVFSERAL